MSAIAFFDGQNIFKSAQEAFPDEVPYPNFDPRKLAEAIAASIGVKLSETRFYTGVHVPHKNAPWAFFWAQKKTNMSRAGVKVTTLNLKYRMEDVTLNDGTVGKREIAREKGIDVRIAIDMVRTAIAGKHDYFLLFSQDNDLSEAVAEVKEIARSANREIKVVTCYPTSATSTNMYGVSGCDQNFCIQRDLYQECLDKRTYSFKPPEKRKPSVRIK